MLRSQILVNRFCFTNSNHAFTEKNKTVFFRDESPTSNQPKRCLELHSQRLFTLFGFLLSSFHVFLGRPLANTTSSKMFLSFIFTEETQTKKRLVLVSRNFPEIILKNFPRLSMTDKVFYYKLFVIQKSKMAKIYLTILSDVKNFEVEEIIQNGKKCITVSKKQDIMVKTFQMT